MLIALSTIICIARMAQAEYVALDAESILHTVEFSTGTASVWSDYTGPIFRARRGLSEAIEQSLHDIGITQRGARFTVAAAARTNLKAWAAYK